MTPEFIAGVFLMRNILIIGAGGFIGAVLRYLAVLSMQVFKGKTNIPLGTLLVNVVGCLLIGFLAVLDENGKVISTETRNFLIVGILGAFTTFSTFGYETVNLFKSGLAFYFVINIVLQVVLGLAAVWAGMNLADLIQVKS
jgi:CrcB protein